MVNVKIKLQTVAILAIVILFGSGFRIQRGYKWDVVINDPTIWLDFDEEVLSHTFSDLTFADDSTILQNVAEADQSRTIINAIIDDYNAIATSFIRLGMTDNPQPEDSDISTADLPGRTIKVSFGTPPAIGAVGYASSNGSGSIMEDCQITLSKSALSSAEAFKRTLTHELGHCMDLDHTHSDRDSIMSYNVNGVHRLGVDEKIALTYLYPTDDDYAKEVATLGISCSRQ